MKIGVVSVNTEEGKQLEQMFKDAIPTVDGLVLTDSLYAPFDVLIVCGGDGFLLDMVGKWRNAVKAFFGINLGTIGFMMNECDRSNLGAVVFETLKLLASREYKAQRHRLLRAEFDLADKKSLLWYALNDVYLKAWSSEHDSIARLAVRIDGEELPTISADGVILANPAGSTSYSLSAGGPPIDYRVPCFILTPLSPQRSAEFANLTMPVVLSADSVVEIEVLEIDKRPVRAVVDGLIIRDARRVRVTVDKKEYVDLLYKPDWHYLKRLARKVFGERQGGRR